MQERLSTHPENSATKEAESFRRALRIGIMGAMASGKSTLACLMGEKWGVDPIEERFQSNPYLSEFYGYPEGAGISFKTQMCFLGLKVQQMLSSKKEEGELSINFDKAVLPQVEIFVPSIEMDSLYGQVQAEMGFMGSREYRTYKMMYEIFRNDTAPPIDLYVIVDAPAEVLLERVLDERKRKLEHPGFFEKYPDYLGKLARATRKWCEEMATESPVVLIDSVSNNFADNTKKKKKVLMQIEDGIINFFDDNPHTNEDTEIPYGRDGAQLIVPDFLKTK